MDGVGRTAARDVVANVDSPSVDSSIKDGYAVISGDLKHASPSNPVELKVKGSLAAGDKPHGPVEPGGAIRILSGAPIPRGCDAVLADEFARGGEGSVTAFADAHPGRNILFRGDDVRSGERLLEKGEIINPQKVGLMAAGGVRELMVFRLPRVGLLATGNEVIMPGRDIEEGKLYASNLALQRAWLQYHSIPVTLNSAGDSLDDLKTAALSILNEADILITSGGAWKGERDLIITALEHLGWTQIYHRVRLGPGKAIAMGLLEGKVIFCLPGGPPSNEAAFLLLALPAVCATAGHKEGPFLNLTGRLDSDINGQMTWTQVVHCSLTRHEGEWLLRPIEMKRRIISMARAQAIVLIPEGVERIRRGEEVEFRLL
jgi:molybdopterin molybdotransferase